MYLLWLLFIITLINNCNTYDYMYSEYIVNLAQATYCVDTFEWDCYTCISSFQLSNIIENRGVKLLLGFDDITGYIFIAFRGSSNIENWIQNLKFQQISPWNNTIMVDKGFYEDYEFIKEALFDSLYEISKLYNTTNIVITGHSLGSALSTIVSYEIIKYYDYSIKYLITYGSPRVGNKDFANDFSNIIKKYDINSYRITHANDMIPHLPQTFMNYYHITNEIWYNEANSEYIICKDDYYEDQSCSDSCAPYNCISISNHLYYLNTSFGGDYC